jgi:aldose 1-epimerase
MSVGSRVELRTATLFLELAPDLGGSVTAFQLETPAGPVDLMRRASPEAILAQGPLAASSFPLFPYSNRIRDGKFRFRGQSYEYPSNAFGYQHLMHGHGWVRPWQVGEHREHSVELVFDCGADLWRWPYRATQHFELGQTQLKVTSSITNLSQEVMPVGAGLHPYFDRTHKVRLTARLSGVWVGDDSCLPERCVELPPEWDFGAGLRVEELRLDHCFAGWDGSALIEWPERGTALGIEAAPLFSQLVVYVPPGERFFCVEPVSNANDAFNLADRGVEGTGMRELAPGATLSGLVTFRVNP